MTTIDNWLPGLLKQYGNEAGISKENHINGQVRYRINTVPSTPGIWISKKGAFDILYYRALNDPKADKPEYRIHEYQVASA